MLLRASLRFRPALRAAARVLAAALLASASGGAARAADVAWVELGGQGKVLVRAVVEAASCPQAEVDGRGLALRLRAGPVAGFENLVCEAEIPRGSRSASLLGRPLPLPKPQVEKIVVFGDTGCRLRGLNVQACDDPKAWPFARVAALAAAERPDLVIHVGDYYYRETACPLDWRGCAQSPHGDAWATWRADFIDPAAPLLAAAPFVFARGNHETCERGGHGWFRLLDAGASTECGSVSAPYTVDLGGLDLFVLDSALAVDTAAPLAAVERVRAQLRALPTRPGAPLWILTHRPVWGLVPVARLGPLGPVEIEINRTLQAAVRDQALLGTELILSGHIHHFEALSFGEERPAQLIVGTGGDVGEAADSQKPDRSPATVDGLAAARLEFDRFGYVVLTRSGSTWSGVFKDSDGQIRATCALAGRNLTCEPAPARANR